MMYFWLIPVVVLAIVLLVLLYKGATKQRPVTANRDTDSARAEEGRR